MKKTKSDDASALCGTCLHFQSDPVVLEKTWSGLTSMSSGFGSVRATDGLCDRHDLYLSDRDSCPDHAPQKLKENLPSVELMPPPRAFLRKAPPEARVIAIIGGGFTGTMTLANLLRQAQGTVEPLHFVLIDDQPAIGEGVAYRTNDSRHLLNVPVEKMSAWPDRPDDFLKFAQSRDPSIKPGDFLPRKLYGQYVRQQLFDLAELAEGRVSVELIQEVATRLAPSSDLSKWHIATAAGRTLPADLAIVTLGHRPPADDFSRRWQGPHNRFVADPWSAPILSQIGPDEPVLLLGCGLTAVDTILSLDDEDRTAPITAVSRRGLWPQAHARQPMAAVDLSQIVANWLAPSRPLTVRELLRTLRRHVARVATENVDWRQVIDGLRPYTAKLWARLDMAERKRFLRHGRPFWEIHRHRMAPAVAERLGLLRARKRFDLTAGNLVSAEADGDGINVMLRCRGNSATRKLRVAWVINCTGPGAHDRQTTHPILRPLIDSGVLSGDALGLGLDTDIDGRALNASGSAQPSLLIAGTLRKATLWESTAVPELRQQAATVAKIALRTLATHHRS
jgi:uncharacterized NAD(P)/FAD-binding protein YdhS